MLLLICCFLSNVAASEKQKHSNINIIIIMEGRSDQRIKQLVESIYRLLLGVEQRLNNKKSSSLVRVNAENLSKYGDLCFLTKLETWRKVFPDNFEAVSRSVNILEYYLIRNGLENKYEEATKEAFRNIIRASSNWLFEIEKCAMLDERACLFLNRKNTLAKTVSRILKKGASYGEFESKDESFFFNIVKDPDSELTNLRLRLVKNVAQNIVQAHGYKISKDIAATRYQITTKSKSSSKDCSNIILCGVAKNHVTKTKEVGVTEVEYCGRKLAELLDTTEQKLGPSNGEIKEGNLVLEQLAEAAIALEFLAVKPSRAITLELDSVNGKGSSFVLYNTARISAIFERFEEECSRGNYPSLVDIEEVDFSRLDQEEEWELAYNFLLGYPEMIETCLRLEGGMEISPQYICSFLSRFCNKFSAYYRRVRILTEGRDHLLPTMMARLYLLKAIKIVICNALRLLNIDPVSRM